LGAVVAAPRITGRRELLPPVAFGIKDKWMEIDLAAAGVDHHEASGHAWLACRIVFEAEATERLLGSLQVGAGNGEIEVVVWARLTSEQGIDSPAAIDPERRDASGIERIEYFDQIVIAEHAEPHPRRK
jgi:hypothetical protein